MVVEVRAVLRADTQWAAAGHSVVHTQLPVPPAWLGKPALGQSTAAGGQSKASDGQGAAATGQRTVSDAQSKASDGQGACRLLQAAIPYTVTAFLQKHGGVVTPSEGGGGLQLIQVISRRLWLAPTMPHRANHHQVHSGHLRLTLTLTLLATRKLGGSQGALIIITISDR